MRQWVKVVASGPCLGGIATVLFPFLLFWWTAPFVSPWTIGNDYVTHFTQEQQELLFSVRYGTFPLYAPGFWTQPAACATQAQLWHPVTWLANLCPGYWNGWARDWNTLIHLLFCGLAHLFLLRFLLRAGVQSWIALLASTVTVYNLRMLDLLRYGPALEAYTGHLFLCSSLGLAALDSPRPSVRTGLAIVGATYWTVCSGHPQMAYFALGGSAVFLLVIPYFLDTVIPGRNTSLRQAARVWLFGGGHMAMGVLLSAAYAIPFYTDFLRISSRGTPGGQSYLWAASFGETAWNALCNFCDPFRANVHGAFGGTSLYLLAALVPCLVLCRVKPPPVIWGIWGCGLGVFLLMLGMQSPVHRLAWGWLPFFSTFRVPGRVALCMPILLMLLLIWLLTAVGERTEARVPAGRCGGRLSPRAILAVLGIAVSAALLWAMRGAEMSPYAPCFINSIPRSVDVAVAGAGTLSLALLVPYRLGVRGAHLARVALVLTVVGGLALVLRYGTWTVRKSPTPTFDEMLEQKRTQVNRIAVPIPHTLAVQNQCLGHIRDPFLAKFYGTCVPALDETDAYRKLATSRRPDQVVVVGDPTSERARAEGTDSLGQGTAELALARSSYNRFVFSVAASGAGYVCLSLLPADRWKGFVNGKPVRVWRGNGEYPTVEVTSGRSEVEFRFRSPGSMLGMTVSCITLAGVLGYGVYRSCRGRRRALFLVLAVLVPASVFAWWRHALYDGPDLGCRYIWDSNMLDAANLAYGRVTRCASSQLSGSRAVDGSLDPEDAFLSDREDRPTWAVDLGRPCEVARIVVHEGRLTNPSINRRPLQIGCSADDQTYAVLLRVTTPPTGEPFCIQLESPRQMRYVFVRADGPGSLQLVEVQVYGPSPVPPRASEATGP